MFKKYFNWLFGKSSPAAETELAGTVTFTKVDPEAEVAPKPKKKEILQEEKACCSKAVNSMILQRGSEGDLVLKLQKFLNVDPVSKFGPKTEAAVKAWQSKHGLPDTGIVTDAVWAKMFPAANHVIQPVSVPTSFKLDALKGHVPDHVIAQIPTTAIRYGITTPLRLAHFLAQCDHESANWTAVRENLNYSAKGLLGIFRKYFPTPALATAYQRQPDKIANRVYASRMGNGPEISGDGYKYRGRGYIQLTGRQNYLAFDQTVPEDVVNNPDLVATTYPLSSAGYFFKSRDLWRICDMGATPGVVTAVTKRVNGGTHGLADRVREFNTFYKLLT